MFTKDRRQIIQHLNNSRRRRSENEALPVDPTAFTYTEETFTGIGDRIEIPTEEFSSPADGDFLLTVRFTPTQNKSQHQGLIGNWEPNAASQSFVLRITNSLSDFIEFLGSENGAVQAFSLTGPNVTFGIEMTIIVRRVGTTITLENGIGTVLATTEVAAGFIFYPSQKPAVLGDYDRVEQDFSFVGTIHEATLEYT